MNKKKQDRTYLNWYAQRGPEVFGDWVWLRDRYLPTIERFKSNARNTNDFYILSDSYYKLGDIFDFMEAPLESLKWYKKSIKYDTQNAAAFREAGDRLSEMGRYRQAIQYLLKALELNPDDNCAKSDLEHIVEYSKDKKDTNLFTKNDKGWKIDEMLAQGKFTKVLHELSNPKKVKDHQRRARAYGGINQKDDFIAEWNRISEMNGPIEWRPADGFFMPYAVWNTSEFWYVLRKSKGRFIHGTWPQHDSLWEFVIRSPEKRRIDSKEDIKRLQKRILLFINYQIARTSKNTELSKQLAKAHPNWPEAKYLYGRLKDS